MFNFLEKIRRQPEGLRKRIAFLAALGFSAVILTIWVTVIFPDWHENQLLQSRAVANSPSPLSTFGASIGDGMTSLSNQLGEIKNSISSLATDTTHFIATTSEASVIQSDTKATSQDTPPYTATSSYPSQ